MLRSLLNFVCPNQLTVTLSIDSVAVNSRQGGLPVLPSRVLEQKPIAIIKTANELPWQLAIHKLESLLQSMQVKRKTQLQVVLSSDFVRYLILPGQTIAMNTAEKSAYAIATYRDVYGAVVDGWHIKLHDAAPNQSTIAVAVDEKLLAILKQVSLKHQLKLNSVQPYLMSAFNTLNHQLSNINGYLVALKSGRLLLISLRQGQCQNLRTIMVDVDWQTELKHLLMRESLLGDTSGREVLVYAPAIKKSALISIEGWNIRRIGQTHNQAVNDRHFVLLEAST